MTTQTSFLKIKTEQEPQLGRLPLRERPTARIAFYGAGSVGVVELLASLIGGPKQLEIATSLVSKYKTLAKLSKAPLNELKGFAGVGEAVATRLKAAVELGRRLMTEVLEIRPQITSPADAAHLMMLEMGMLEKEELRVVLLNTRNRVLDITTVYKGSLNTMMVRISELFTEAIRQVASAIIIIHNHPSGDPKPSPEDVRLTKMVVEAGKMLDVEVLDHLIIGQGRFVSLKERGLGFS